MRTGADGNNIALFKGLFRRLTARPGRPCTNRPGPAAPGVLLRRALLPLCLAIGACTAAPQEDVPSRAATPEAAGGAASDLPLQQKSAATESACAVFRRLETMRRIRPPGPPPELLMAEMPTVFRKTLRGLACEVRRVGRGGRRQCV